MYTIIPLQYLQSWFSCREINIGLYCQVKSTVAISFEIFYHFLCLPGIFVALVSRLSENKNSYGCMLFTRNLFVVNLLKHLRSCHFPGNRFDPSSCHASEASVEHLFKNCVERQLFKQVITFSLTALQPKLIYLESLVFGVYYVSC